MGLELRSLFIFIISFLGMWPAFIITTFVVFRQKIRGRVLTILLSSFILGQISLILQTLSYQVLLTLVQPLVFWLCLIFVFKIRVFSAFIMTVTQFLSAIAFEILFYAIISGFDKTLYVTYAKEMVILPGIVMTLWYYLIAYVCHAYRFGFTFLPSRRLPTSTRPFTVRWTSVFLGVAVFVASSSLTLFQYEKWFFVYSMLLVCFITIVLQLLYRKESEE